MREEPSSNVAASGRLFLSYARADLALARPLAEGLRAQGWTVFFDRDSFAPDESWIDALERELASADGFVMSVGPSGITPWMRAEWRQAMLRLTESPGFRRLGVISGSERIEAIVSGFLRSEMHWERIDSCSEPDCRKISALLKRGNANRPAPGQEQGLVPFLGFQKYGPDDAHLFFGRRSAVAALRQRVLRKAFVLVVGGSGCGKSSLVSAGLFPSLQAQEWQGSPSSQWQYVDVRPGARPMDGLALGLAGLRPGLEAGDRLALQRELRSTLSEEAGLERALSSLAEGRPVLVHVDQFEELFEANPEESNRFIDQLLDALDREDLALRAVATMRSDALMDYCTHERLGSYDPESIWVCPHLEANDIREIITTPLRVCGQQIDDELVDVLIDDAGGGGRQHRAAELHALQAVRPRRSI